MAEAIEERADTGRALEDGGPLAERPIRSNHDRRLHISLRDDLEEQIGVAVAVGEVSEFIDHEQRGLDVAVQAAADTSFW